MSKVIHYVKYINVWNQSQIDSESSTQMMLSTNRTNHWLMRKAYEDMATVTEEEARYRQQANHSKINPDSKEMRVNNIKMPKC